MQKTLETCSPLIQTDSTSLSEHLIKVNKFMNEIQPCKPLRQTNSYTVAEHKYRLKHYRYDYDESVSSDEEESIWDTLYRMMFV